MAQLRVEICNERLLPRFGVDRILILLARHLAAVGYEVAFRSLRCDRDPLLAITADVEVFELPPGLNMEATESTVAGRLFDSWRTRRPDVVVVGGWPFFRAAALAGSLGVSSVFIDAGAVAQDGLPEPQLTMQRELRRIRQLTLPGIDRILPISDFIRRTQTELDRGHSSGVHTVLLGADHMAIGTFGSQRPAEADAALLQRLEARVASGDQLLLALGRFEAEGYKNSPAVYEIFGKVLQSTPAARLLLLDGGQDCAVPKQLSPYVELLGTPDDLTLQAIMGMCTAGISTSLWEGFNLPIAEMQWLDRPAVAFCIGAHPEVIADPRLLCHTPAEMAARLVEIFEGKLNPGLSPAFETFRQRRQWSYTLTEWERTIREAAPERNAPVSSVGVARRRIVLADVTNASLDTANPGVIRVVRRLCSELQRDERLEMVFAGWSRDLGEFVFLDRTRSGLLESYGGPKDGLGMLAAWKGDATPETLVSMLQNETAESPILFLPEVLFDGHAEARVNWGLRHGFRPAAILYDVIPVSHPELCDPSVCAGFPAYLGALTRAEAVWTISDSALSEYRRYLESTGQAATGALQAIHLPGQLGDHARKTQAPDAPGDEVRILFVSTLEPRKNHKRLLQAFESLCRRRPDLRLKLVLVGNRYAGAPEIAEEVEAIARNNGSVEWLGVIDDTRLAEEFAKSAFTVYASLVEGYGLPIVESLWMGRPCLCHNDGVMRELADQGGCLTVDMKDIGAISDALERLASDEGLLQKLGNDAREREIGTWESYAESITERLLAL